MSRWHKLLPWFFLALFGADIVAVLLPKREGKFHTAEFGRWPVLMNGRLQPWDSVGRNALLQIRGTGDVPLEQVPSWKFWRHPKKLNATAWLLEVMCKPALADTRPIFLIHHPELISELKLDETGLVKSGLRYYTFQELAPLLPEVTRQGQHASLVPGAQRTTYQQQVLKLANALALYQQLKSSIQPPGAHNFAELVADYQTQLAAFRARSDRPKHDDESFRKLATAVRQWEALAQTALPLAVPPADPADNDNWDNIGTALLTALHDGTISPAVGFYARLATAYGNDDAGGFNAAVDGYRDWLAARFARAVARGRAEFYFNRIQPFLHATIIYIFAFVLAGAALVTLELWPGLAESLRRSALYLICLALVVHTGGLVFRMVLAGRPPVTNLYSSAIFIGWAACVLGLILERTYPVGFGSAVAGLAGFVTLLIAHNLALGGDTMEMLRAVLDTNFWLATHVITITLGYSAAFVAGGLALGYVLLGVFTPWLARPVAPSTLGRALTDMVYAIVCFTLLFSAVGTVLGGIWADQSWGRFWGWDPKENGALLIVLWYAIILHARRGGLVRDRGLMNLVIFGNIITAFSWFGVNMLGIGLHSYGFMDAAFKWLMLFNAGHAAVIVLGLMPVRRWRSFRES